MPKVWEERRPAYHSYFEEGSRSTIYGDVRPVNIEFDAPVVYVGLVYTPGPYGTKIPPKETLEEAKEAVEQECDRQSL